MPEQVEKREIDVSYAGPVASAVADAIGEMQESGSFVQHLGGDIEDMTAEVYVRRPHEVLHAAKDALVEADGVEADYPDLPDDPDTFGVTAVDITVEEPSTVTIEVRGE